MLTPRRNPKTQAKAYQGTASCSWRVCDLHFPSPDLPCPSLGLLNGSMSPAALGICSCSQGHPLFLCFPPATPSSQAIVSRVACSLYCSLLSLQGILIRSGPNGQITCLFFFFLQTRVHCRMLRWAQAPVWGFGTSLAFLVPNNSAQNGCGSKFNH